MYHSNYFYVIGGLIGDINGESMVKSNIIGRLNSLTTTWTEAGELKNARYGHGAIFNGDVIIIAGGNGNMTTESCSIVNGAVTCVEQAPTLDYYVWYPEMYLVSDAYCHEL